MMLQGALALHGVQLSVLEECREQLLEARRTIVVTAERCREAELERRRALSLWLTTVVGGRRDRMWIKFKAAEAKEAQTKRDVDAATAQLKVARERLLEAKEMVEVGRRFLGLMEDVQAFIAGAAEASPGPHNELVR